MEILGWEAVEFRVVTVLTVSMRLAMETMVAADAVVAIIGQLMVPVTENEIQSRAKKVDIAYLEARKG